MKFTLRYLLMTALTGGGGVLAAFNLRKTNTSLNAFQRCCVEYAIDSGIVLSLAQGGEDAASPS